MTFIVVIIFIVLSDCKDHLVDLVFTLNCSTNSEQNLEDLKFFMTEVIQKFDVDSGGIRVAVYNLWDLQVVE